MKHRLTFRVTIDPTGEWWRSYFDEGSSHAVAEALRRAGLI